MFEMKLFVLELKHNLFKKENTICYKNDKTKYPEHVIFLIVTDLENDVIDL